MDSTSTPRYKYSDSETRRQAVLIWEIFGKPGGEDGLKTIQMAYERTFPDQMLTTIRSLISEEIQKFPDGR
jgi:hypothetical protein